MVEFLVSSRMAWDCGVADLAAGCCSGGRMPNAGARRALRSLAGTPWSCRTDPLSRRFSSSIGNRLREMLENWPEPQNKAEPNTRTETRSAWRGRDREREKESDGVLGRARQLRLPTMAAQGGLHLRVSSRREKRQVERERERERERLKGGALLGVTLCGAPPQREKTERDTERGSSTEGPTIACLTC